MGPQVEGAIKVGSHGRFGCAFFFFPKATDFMTLTKETAKLGDAQAAAGKFLTFQLGSESYGIPALKVREIIRMTDITAVPQMPDYIKGVINLRGKIIPIIDLRLRFRLANAGQTERTCIVVAQTAAAHRANAPVGFVVDAVEEVLNIAATEIEATPDFGTAQAVECMTGLAKIDGKVKALLDVDRVVARELLRAVEQTAS